MRTKLVTPTGEQDIRNIYSYINRDNPSAAERYYRSAYDTFAELDDAVLPRRASGDLPDYIRAVTVRGFKGYTLRIAYFSDEAYLLSAHAPGLPDEFKDARTLLGLRSLP